MAFAAKKSYNTNKAPQVWEALFVMYGARRAG